MACAWQAVSAVAVLVLVVSGCGGGSTSGDNCAADPASCACTGDDSCADPSPRCDTRTGKCVSCLPTADNCPLSQHCIFSSGGFACVAKEVCASADDCPTVNGKAQLCCDGKCADRYNDANNCGACGKVCDPVANANTACVNGSCGVTLCKAGFGDCDGKVDNGCEADVTSDVARCGACDKPCAKAPNSSLKCEAGKCAYECMADFADCDSNPQNGCETSTSTNAMNCGACGKTCPGLPNAATTACAGGMCVVETCKPGFADCNRNAGDGCEADTQSDPNHCTGCGKRCPAVMNGAAACSAGSCGVGKCNANFGDCDGNVLNGCEQDISSDARNCGSCGMVCVAPNAQLTCQGAMCQLQSCNQGFSDCDNNALNGCEAIVSRDLKNCGACGVVCPVPLNATAQCSSGVCGLGSCMYGWGDCNKSLNDGCEVDLLQVANCGACGAACAVPPNGVAACKQAACAVGMCSPGFLDCDNKFVNGCEINVLNDGNNCGGCGSVCMPPPNMKTGCAAGKCVPGGCNPGFVDCNNNINDGCEAATDSDPNNCGGCKIVCPQNLPACVAGVCSVQTCLNNPKWQAVNCSTGEWVWSRDKVLAKDQITANAKRVLATATAGSPQALCSLDGKGWISTQTFVMVGCNVSWYHIGGRYTGDCGGHDGELWRHLVLGPNDCYAY